MDETYVKTTKDDDKNDKGGFGGGFSTKNNTPVVGIKQRNGNIKAFASDNSCWEKRMQTTKYKTSEEITINTVRNFTQTNTLLTATSNFTINAKQLTTV